MAQCLDEGKEYLVKMRFGNNMQQFQLNGDELRRYLSREEIIRKVFVVESEGCEKVEFLSDVPFDRTFNGADEPEEFIQKIAAHSK